MGGMARTERGRVETEGQARGPGQRMVAEVAVTVTARVSRAGGW